MPCYRHALIALVLLGVPSLAEAQTAATNAVPSANANVWNGKDHQPTAASAPPLGAKTAKKVDHTLNTLDTQLMNQKLPKAPAASP